MQFVNKKEFLGETLGTFLLVLFGCGSVAVSQLFGLYHGLVESALVWGVGVVLAIYLVRHISYAHFNPAVTIAMVFSKRMSYRKLPTYILGQFLGAFLAGIAVYLLFEPSINNYDNLHGIVRGSVESVSTAKIFGEFYSVKGSLAIVSLPLAMGAEIFGTIILLLLVFALTEDCNVGRPDDSLTPLFVGLTVMSIICLIAPLTQAGINPARDFGPRMVTWIFGWGEAAFPDHSCGFFWVYIFSPVLGASLAALFFTKVLEPAMIKASDQKKK